MCGIAGIVGESVSEQGLTSLGTVMAHRGPDGMDISIRANGRVGLAHRRLAIIDLTESGSQPMRSPAGSEIVYNGEIYNYLEIRRELEDSGVRFRGTSDTEVLLAAYDRWGDECVNKLNGMFAFAIYDERRDVLFAARDRFGEKPFYYTWTPDGTFVFASEIKGVLAHQSIPAEPDPQAIYRLLAHREVDRDPETFFHGIRALPPAHTLTLRLGTSSLQIKRYWCLRPQKLTGDRYDLVAGFRELLFDSVRLRLRSDVGVGSSLSGGLDSSAIVGVIAALGVNRSQHTFSARFPGSRFDEGEYIEDVVRNAGAIPHDVAPDPARIPDEWDSLTWHQETPFLSLSIYAQWCVMRLAAQSGVTVLLDGQGADEILAGYRSYMAGRLRDLLSGGHGLVAARVLFEHVHSQGTRELPVIAYHFLPRAVSRGAKQWVRAIGLNRDFAAAYRTDPSPILEYSGSQLEKMLHATLTRTVLPPLLRYGDRNSMAFSREVRLPFLDHRLVEYAFALPDELKLDGIRTKVVLREAMKDVLPAAVESRKDKLGYSPPHTDWLRGPMRDWVGDILHSRSFVQRPWMDPNVAQRAWGKYLRGAARYEPDILRWISLEGWARVFIDGQRPPTEATEQPQLPLAPRVIPV